MLPATPYKIDDYEPLLVALQNVLGVVVPDDQRNNLAERIEPLLSNYKLDAFASLAEKMQSCEAGVRSDVLDVISQCHLVWPLSAELKKVLHEYIFTQLPDKARIWVVGCGQGQPAYSVAMEAARYNHKTGESKNFQLVATDVSQDDINQARLATYSMSQLSTLSDEDKALFITLDNENGNGQVKDKIRQSISFSEMDLTEDVYPFGQMDLIICPEVLVYFSNGVKAGILQRLTNALKPGGIFVAGNNQNIPVGQMMERVSHPAGIFYRQKG